MQRLLIMLATAALLVVAAAPVAADDFAPAFFRGDPLSVAAEWEFIGQNLVDLPPDYLNWVGDGVNPYNVNCFVHTHPQFVYWQEDPDEPGDGRAFTTDAPGQLLFFLCNFIDDMPFKYIWVQITYGETMPGLGGMPYIYEVVAPNEGSNDWTNPVFGTPIEEGGMPGFRTEFWVITYNPDREFVNLEIPPHTWVDQIWIETISTFEIDNDDMSWGKVKNLFR